MTFRQAEFLSYIAIWSRWPKVLDIETNRKRRDAVNTQPVSFNEFPPRFLPSRHHHHVEQVSVQPSCRWIRFNGAEMCLIRIIFGLGRTNRAAMDPIQLSRELLTWRIT